MDNDSRTRNVAYNMSFALLNKVVSIITSFINRTVFIYILGDAVLGLNSLFSTILTVLSLSELGISSAITFHLYKPIENRDYTKLMELTALYERCYKVIGIVMFFIGIILIPFLKDLVNFPNNNTLDGSIQCVYVLTLLRSVLPYLFYGFSQSIIEANQRQRVVSIYTMVANIVTTGMLTTGLLLTHNYYTFLIITIGMEMIKNIFLYVYSRKNYKYVKNLRHISISKETKKSIFKDVFSVFIFKVTTTIGQSIDNILISIMLGTIIVGYYGNYTMITTYVISTVTMLINSFSGSVGSLIASKTKEYSHKVFLEIDFINFILMAIVTVCLNQLLNPFIHLWLRDSRYLLSWEVIALICANNYIISSLDTIYLFRNAFGLFKYGKYNFFFCGILNLILSILLGKSYGIIGILGATFISYFIISTFPFPYYLYKKGFKMSPVKYIIEIFIRYGIVIAIAFICHLLCSNIFKENTWFNFIGQGILCVVVSIAVVCLIYFRTERFNRLLQGIRLLCK